MQTALIKPLVKNGIKGGVKRFVQLTNDFYICTPLQRKVTKSSLKGSKEIKAISLENKEA
jgi:hypothetical protein